MSRQSRLAEAAGYDLSDDGEGHAKVSVCTGTTDLCTSNADCTSNACVPYFIDGRSLVSVLNGGDGHLNCATHSLGSPQQIGKIQTTRAELGDRLDDWQTCVTNFSNSGVSCEVSP